MSVVVGADVTRRPRLRYVKPVEQGARASAGLLMVVGALGILFYGVVRMRDRDYLGCIVLTFTGWSLVRAGVEVLRSSAGE